ncbi:MAG: hypothetical protein IIZ53_03385 [Ruminococcus sp.]|nr:hypothetical protein [Ruminococcus sp.]
MIDAIIEELVGLAFEGMIEGSVNSRVPKPVRWILRIVLFAVYAALAGVCILVAVQSFSDGNIAMGIFMLALLALFAGFTAVKIVKRLKR